MKKLLLIYPKSRTDASGFGHTASWSWPPLPLGYVAALTPKNWNVRIVDEYMEDIDFDERVDLVGITSYTLNAMRAYELSALFRQRGIPVVLGGIHVSMVAEEAAAHADAVVVGEAESVWDTVIADCERGDLQKMYHGQRLSLENLPLPRRDLFSEKYGVDIVQATRGCPFRCEYCSVTAFHGATYRKRPVSEVLDEVETTRHKMLFFSDDNFFGISREDIDRARSLCEGMVERKLKKIWITQATIDIAEHPDVLECAYRSGCRGLYVGIESILPATLKEMKKGVNLRCDRNGGLAGAIKKIHDKGLFVIGPLIFGSDNDDIGVFKKSLEFMNRAGIDVPQIGIVTPFPGTKLFDRMAAEGRLMHSNFPEDWDKYDTEHIYFKPKRMDPADLLRGVDYLIRETFKMKNVLRGAVRTLFATRSPISALIAYRMSRDSAYFNDYPRKGKFERPPPLEADQ